LFAAYQLVTPKVDANAPQPKKTSTILSLSTQDRTCKILTEETTTMFIVDPAEVIDMSQRIESLRAEYGKEFHRSQEALSALQNLWGFQTNDCGVVVDGVEEEILTQHGLVSASLTLAEGSKGYWLYGLSALTSVS